MAAVFRLWMCFYLSLILGFAFWGLGSAVAVTFACSLAFLGL